MNARSALFDVYGDHVGPRGGAAPVAALVKIVEPLGISAAAVRTAVSRMVAQQWLVPVRLPEGAGYRLTERAERRLSDAANRIYRNEPRPWDRRWHLLAMGRVPDRARRERVRSGLSYLGYAPLTDGTWLSPHASAELTGLLALEGVEAFSFTARYDGSDLDAGLTTRAWDLDELGTAYARWLDEAQALVDRLSDKPSDCEEFVIRSRLVHEWRKFLFRDPGLPRELLPPGWPGDEAAAFFDSEASRLLPGAKRYVDLCLMLGATNSEPLEELAVGQHPERERRIDAT
ncbi:MAG: PaaX family transcriptional regulator [Nocardioidaceae bacterium]